MLVYSFFAKSDLKLLECCAICNVVCFAQIIISNIDTSYKCKIGSTQQHDARKCMNCSKQLKLAMKGGIIEK